VVVRDEHIGKRMKCPQCKTAFVATPEDIEEPDAPEEVDQGQKIADMITAQWPAVAGVGLIVFGLIVIVSTGMTRAGLLVMGLGMASIGYWALSSSNKDYNF
jgi:hypothetical protein